MTPAEEKTIREFAADPSRWEGTRAPFQMLVQEIDRLRDVNSELLDACKRIVQEDQGGEISGGAIEDCKAAIEKAEAQS